jgi:hypothetical protein
MATYFNQGGAFGSPALSTGFSPEAVMAITALILAMDLLLSIISAFAQNDNSAVQQKQQKTKRSQSKDSAALQYQRRPLHVPAENYHIYL